MPKAIGMLEENSHISYTFSNCSVYHFSRMLSPPPGIHIVSERTKQFESGRPLSPDGSSVDRTSLYRSELSR